MMNGQSNSLSKLEHSQDEVGDSSRTKWRFSKLEGRR